VVRSRLSNVRQGCNVAPDLVLNPMDWILDCTVLRRLGVNIGEETFTDLDNADDVALLAEMLETLVALQEEAAPLGLQVHWSKTKIQHIREQSLNQSMLQVAAESVEVVNGFAYLGSQISYDAAAGSLMKCDKRTQDNIKEKKNTVDWIE